MPQTSINIDTVDHLPQGGCPYCSRVFRSREHIKRHLEPDKVCAQPYLSLPQSHQEDSVLEDSNGAVHLRSLGSLDSISSCRFNPSSFGSIAYKHTDTYIAENKSKAIQAFGNSTPHTQQVNY